MNRFQKFVVTGALILGPILSAGAASAAPAVSNTDTLSSLTQKYGIDLNSMLKGNSSFSSPNVIWKSIVIKYPFQFGNAGNPTGQITTPSKPSGSGSNSSTPAGSTSGNGSNSGTPAGSTSGNGSNSGTPAGSTSGNGSNSSTPAGSTSGNGSNSSTPAGNTSGSGSSQDTAGTSSSASYASQVVDLVNQERTKAGLKPLTSDSALTGMALAKAKDMYSNNYFDHTSPTYGSPFDMMKSFGISYSYAGENIAKGQRNPQEVMTSWMNSAGHRQNILSPNYTKIGVAYYNGEWVQEFIAN